MIKRGKFDHFQMLFQMRFSSRVGCWITGGSGSPLAKVPRSGPCINGPSMTCRGTCSSFLASQVATKISHGIQWNERNLTGTPAKFDARNLGFNCRKNGKLSRVESRNLGFLWFPAVFFNLLLPYPKSSECILLGIALNELVDAVDEPRKGGTPTTVRGSKNWFYILGQLFILFIQYKSTDFT